MPTALLLRFCFCSLLIVTLILETSAQRTGRRRAPAVTTTENTIQKAHVSRRELRTIPGELFSRDTSVKEILNDDTKEKNHADCKETNGINKANKADAYPYLSADGLRLYFTSNREGGHGRFFISTRKSINDPFTDPKVLSKNLTDGYYAGTLTADELTLCMVNSGDMYISIRSDKNAEFPLPIKVTGTIDEYSFGPSISQDGTEIFVTVKIKDKDATRIYKRTGLYTVEEKGLLAIPEGYDADPGQLSKDGLSYYLSLDGNDGDHLWKYTRTSTADNFSNPVELPDQIKGLKNILQPSLNGDGSIIVFVTSPNNGWDGDDILLVNTFNKNFVYPKLVDSVVSIAGNTVKMIDKPVLRQFIEYSSSVKQDLNSATDSRTKIKAQDISGGEFQLKVYPNPFVGGINIVLSENPGDGVQFNLYDLSGKVIRKEKLYDIRTNMSLNQLSAGAYTYQVIDDKGKLISSGKLVKGQ